MAITLLFLAGGLILSAYAFYLLVRRRKLIAAGVNGLIGFPILVVGGFLGMVLLNLQTYQQLTHEVVLAEISIGQPTQRGLPLRMVFEDHADVYLIDTPEWRLDARFVKWKPWLSLFGKEPVVRLERLEERGISSSGTPVMNRYELVDESRWTEELISFVSDNLGLIDSVYGSSVYMPAFPGAEYRVSASISGLVARPANLKARQAILQWNRP